MKFFVCLLFFLCLFAGGLALAAVDSVRVGVLQFGTVHWELDTLKRHGFDKKYGLDVVVEPYASKQATAVAFRGQQTDIFVTDWLWAAKQRSEGFLVSTIPFSTALGSVMVAPTVDSIEDLSQEAVGVAGGYLDKSWLIFQAWLQKQHPRLLESVVQNGLYAAPPLLNAQIEQGRINAALNFWHYAARLQAKGFDRLLDVKTMISDLGIPQPVAMIGYCFTDAWAQSSPDVVARFSAAVDDARSLLRSSSEEWVLLRPLMRVSDDRTFELLKQGFQAGIPARGYGMSQAAAMGILAILMENEIFVRRMGSSLSLSGIFWNDRHQP